MVITSKHKRVKKRPIEAVIFDYDGVIGKTDSRQFEWFKYWAKRNNTSFSYTTTKEFMEFYNETINNQPKGTNWRDGVQQVYDKLSLPCDMRDKTHPVWPAYDAYKLANPAALYEGIADVIKELWVLGSLQTDALYQNKRTRLAINTSNTWESIGEELATAKLLPYFDLRVTREVLDLYHGANQGNMIMKPSKISIALALNHLVSRVTNTMHIGDSLGDLQSSVAVTNGLSYKQENLIVIGAAWGYEGRAYLEKGIQTIDGRTHHFDEIIDEPRELPLIYKKYLKCV